MEEVISVTKECSYNGVDYIIQVKGQADVLVIELEQKYDTSFWRNTFTASYIEELTQKTGNRKNFADFVKLLVAAIKNPNLAQLNLDILTQQDLENLKAKKQGGSGGQQSNPNLAKINKRYVILSSMNQVDKVHYPLSLNFEENQDPEKLKSTIRKLKMELDESKSQKDLVLKEKNSGESFFMTENVDKKLNSTNSSIQNSMSIDQLRSENDLLRSKVKRMEETLMQKKGAIEMDQIIKDRFELEEQMDLVRKSHFLELERVRTALDQREAELVQKKREIFELKKELTMSFEGDEAGKRLRAHILKLSEESEKELQQSRKTITNQQKEIDKLSIELESFKQQDRKSKNRIKQLETELETATKRGGGGSTRGLSDRLYSPYNKGNTPTNQLSNNRRANSVPAKSYSPSNRLQGPSRGTPTSSKTSFNNSATRTPSNDAIKNKMSPAYNYNFKKQPVATQSATNTRAVLNKQTPSPSSRIPMNSGNNRNVITNLQRQSPSNNKINSNSTNNVQNKNNNIFQKPSIAINNNLAPGRVSPSSQRYPLTQKQKNVSPGTRYTNYMSGRPNNQPNNQPQKEFSDKHLTSNKNSNDLDSRLDKLQHLLIQAKK